MNEMQIFEREDFGQMRTTTIDGEPWLAGTDVAKILGYKNTNDAIISHVDEEDRRFLLRSDFATLENHLPKEVFPVEFVTADVPNRGLTVINESGVYSLIFSSKLPAAKSFKRWVTSEILPTLRKTGSYSMRDTDARLKEAAQILASCRHPKAIPTLVAVLNEYTGVEIKAPGPTYDKSQFDNFSIMRTWIETTSLTLDEILDTPTTDLRRNFTSWAQVNQLKVRLSGKVFCAIMRSIYGFDAKLRQGRASKWYFQM